MERTLRKILGSPKRSGSELLFRCPICKHENKKKLSINLKKGKFQCWTCSYRGNDLLKIIKDFGSPEDKEAWQIFAKMHKIDAFFEVPQEKAEPVSLPPEFKTLTGKILPSSLEARAYLRKRGITMEQIAMFRLGYCTDGEYGGRIIIPSFDLEGDLNFFVGRSYQSHFLRYHQPPQSKTNIIFNELLIDWRKPVILVEGVFDMMVAGTNSIPLLGSFLKEDHKLFQRICQEKERVFLGLDPEAANKQQRIAEMFLDYGLSVSCVLSAPYEDIGAMPQKEFQKAWQKAIEEEFNSRIEMIKRRYG